MTPSIREQQVRATRDLFERTDSYVRSTVVTYKLADGADCVDVPVFSQSRHVRASAIQVETQQLIGPTHNATSGMVVVKVYGYIVTDGRAIEPEGIEYRWWPVTHDIAAEMLLRAHTQL